nr:tetratricopeptide repeat protein [Millisia brevis]
METTVSSRERLVGPDHLDTLTSRTNLSDAYRRAGRNSEAIALDAVTLARGERTLGSDHPKFLSIRRALAVDYQSAGRIAEAVALYEAVLVDSSRILGPDHPDTLTIRDHPVQAKGESDSGASAPGLGSGVNGHDPSLCGSGSGEV